MSTLTVIILAKEVNAELKARLEEISQANEILVIQDARKVSQDFRRLTQKNVKVFAHLLENDFAAQRNWALKHSQSEWTFFLDSDEHVSPQLWSELISCLSETSANAVILSRRDIFLGKKLQFGETGSAYFVRVARTRLAQLQWTRAVHETWNVVGEHVKLAEPLWHNAGSDITHFLQKLHRYASLEPSSRKPLSQGKVLLEFLIYPPSKFMYALLLQSGWRDGVQGWIHAFLMAYYSAIVRVFCWEAWHVRK